MRSKRLNRFRRHRHNRIRNLVLFVIILPCSTIILGYLISSLIILPSMPK